MADLCRECGIRLDSNGLCQCPEVLLKKIEQLDWELRDLRTSHAGLSDVDEARGRMASLSSSLSAGCGGADVTLLQYIERVEWGIDHFLKSAERLNADERERHSRTIRSLRAKLMRERASGLEALAMALPDDCHREGNVLHARARRLRAEAERVDGGGR